MTLIAWHRTKMDYVLGVLQGIYQPKEDVSTMMPFASIMILIHLIVHVRSSHFH